MLARQLQSFLDEHLNKTDMSPRPPGDTEKRFESLRGCRLLPTGRTKNVTHLTRSQIVAAVAGITTENPNYAGFAAIGLTGLRPVGGTAASFNQSETFGAALERLLFDDGATSSLIEVRTSTSEFYTNSHCRSAITYESQGTSKHSYYVNTTAASLLKAGADKAFDPRKIASSMVAETILYPSFFRRFGHMLKADARRPQITLPVPAEDEDEETRKELRANKLGLRPSSRFLNLGVDNQVSWPRQETAITFEGYRFVLLPNTANHAASIHIDLANQKINSDAAINLINQLLSLFILRRPVCNIAGRRVWQSSASSCAKTYLGSVIVHEWLFNRGFRHQTFHGERLQSIAKGETLKKIT